MNSKSAILVGVGGQGAILTAKVLVNGLMAAGYDVKMSEVHGMSQRGGSVSTQVHWGEKVYSPVIGDGAADLMVAFEKMEAGPEASCFGACFSGFVLFRGVGRFRLCREPVILLGFRPEAHMAPVHRTAEALALGVTEGCGNRVQGDFFNTVADGDKISLSHLHLRAADCHRQHQGPGRQKVHLLYDRARI